MVGWITGHSLKEILKMEFFLMTSKLKFLHFHSHPLSSSLRLCL